MNNTVQYPKYIYIYSRNKGDIPYLNINIDTGNIMIIIMIIIVHP